MYSDGLRLPIELTLIRFGLPSLVMNQPPPLEPPVMVQPITYIGGRVWSKESRPGRTAESQWLSSMPSNGRSAG
ncbi:hypothetical protein ACFQ0M_31860 [Kitasatospora aburaviensis]